MRKAAIGWEEDYVKRLGEVGYVRGRGAPTVFYNKEREVRLVAHGDDFTAAGVKEEVERLKGQMEGWYDIKDRGRWGAEVVR